MPDPHPEISLDILMEPKTLPFFLCRDKIALESSSLVLNPHRPFLANVAALKSEIAGPYCSSLALSSIDPSP